MCGGFSPDRRDAILAEEEALRRKRKQEKPRRWSPWIAPLRRILALRAA